VSTARSPLRKLRAEADRIAAQLKSIERGDALSTPDPAGKVAAARAREGIDFVVAMDDKILKITMPWSLIKKTSEAGLSEYILKQMREARDPVH
jgi:hypothetical protein